MAQSYRVGIDVGGTFTDIVFLGDDGTIFTKKVPSTPEDYSRAIVAGLQEVFAEREFGGAAVEEAIHGATVATNAIIEHKGAKTGLITTKGFRDVLEIRRLRMPRLYDMDWEKPPPLVERYLRREVSERINYRGEVIRPLDVAEAHAAVQRLLSYGVESIAVCFINAYANPEHEQKVAAIIQAQSPNMCFCLSSDILPEVKEYERTSTTVINAYVRPVVEGYLKSLEEALLAIGIRAPLLIMQSNGGVMMAAAARERPIHIIESGPAAGVMGSLHLGQRIGYENLITFDMGGTTAKASIVENGELTRSSEYEVGGGIHIGHRLLKGGGYLLRVPAIDLAEVGAGGGSIAWIDQGRSLQVGPRSAGAVPGPVCYDAGGQEPTVTDANVVLGYLNPDYLVGGSLRLNASKAYRAIEEGIAQPLGLGTAEAAYGIHVIANANMIRAVRNVSTERGRDPRDFTLFAFGGSGPVHAADMARRLEIAKVLVPPAPGLFSSFGLLFSEVEHHFVHTYWRDIGELDLADLNRRLAGLEEDGRATLRAEGYPDHQVEIRRFGDMRYAGQNFELTIPAPARQITPQDLDLLKESFAQEHQRTYGYRSDEERVQIVNLRLTARGISPQSRVPGQIRLGKDGAGGPGAPHQRRAYFGPEHRWRDTPVVGRQDLAGGLHAGPLIVEEYDATTVVAPGCRASLDQWGNIAIEIGEARS